tara:strand:- start:1620 stop:2558 length:939 start_codon:yes stop_codon:yes gene_type:complete
MERFSVGSALTHFLNTEGPGSFLWKYALGYIAAFIAFVVVYGLAYYLLVGDQFMALMEDGSPEAATAYMVRFLLLMLILVPLSAIFLAVVEAAALRRYTRFEAFAIRFGADEFRLIGVYALYFGLMIVVYVAVIVIVLALGLFGSLVLGASGAVRWLGVLIPIFGVLAYISGLVVMIWGLLRLSPASSVTIRDQRIRFMSAARLSRGHVWKLFGSYAILVIALYAVMAVVMFAMFALSGMVMFPSHDLTSEGQVTAFDAAYTPAMMVTSFISALVISPMYALIHLCALGIPAKLAVTDREWPGAIEQAEVFD